MALIQSIEDYLAERLLSPQGFAQHQSGKVSKQQLATAVSEITAISQSYLSHSIGAQLPSPIRTIRSAEAYALYYTPINAAKILHIIPMMDLPSGEVRVLDIGCGPGTAGLALLASLTQPINLTCVEHSQPMRAVAEDLLSKFPGRAPLRALNVLPALPPQSSDTFDLIIAANVFAELNTTFGEELLSALIGRLSPGGHLLLIEPGQQAHTRRLMKLRDGVLSTYRDLAPIFPCLRDDACPMLNASESDWCHGALEWAQPRLNAHLDDLLSFNKHRIKYSAFLFQRGGHSRDGFRVLSPPTKSRTGIETLVCGRDLYGIARIRKGTRSPNNRALEKSDTFDRLIASEPLSGDLPEHVVITRASDVPVSRN